MLSQALWIILIILSSAKLHYISNPGSKFAQQSRFVTRLGTIPPSNASFALNRGFWVDWVGFLSMLFGLGGVRGLFKSGAKHQFLRLWSSLWNINPWTLKASKSRFSWWEFWSLAAKNIQPTGLFDLQLATVNPASKCGRRGWNWIAWKNER